MIILNFSTSLPDPYYFFVIARIFDFGTQHFPWLAARVDPVTEEKSYN
jgi:hypothetical protein